MSLGRIYRPAPDQGGSALLLMPAAILIMVVMAAMVLEASAAFLAQRQLQAAVDAAAEDGASAVEPAGIAAGSGVVLSPSRAEQRVRDRLKAHLDGDGDGRFQDLVVEVTVVRAADGCPRVQVSSSVAVEPVFGRTLGRQTPLNRRVASRSSGRPATGLGACAMRGTPSSEQK
ncbi:MAG: TadE/TadG family type IV pilus assembly protein [Acidimicrobiales bacterium]